MPTSVRDRYAVGWFDRMTPRNPLHKSCAVVFNDVTRDHYGDARAVETSRVFKVCMFEKTDQEYVQFFDTDLLVEENNEPWVCTLSLTDLPRHPRTDDRVVCDGQYYTISVVKPINREMPSIVKMLCYPERDEVDTLYNGNTLKVWTKTFYSVVGSDKTPTLVSDFVVGSEYVVRFVPHGSVVAVFDGSTRKVNEPLEFRFKYANNTQLFVIATDSNGLVNGSATAVVIPLLGIAPNVQDYMCLVPQVDINQLKMPYLYDVDDTDVEDDGIEDDAIEDDDVSNSFSDQFGEEDLDG